jgi:hypothetical protein
MSSGLTAWVPSPPRDVLRADVARQLREDRVVGDRDRLRQVDRPEVLALVVVHRPDLVPEEDRDRPRAVGARRRDSLLQRRREHERLERGAGLTDPLHRQVELAVVEVAAAGHCEHGSCVRVDRHERRLRPVRGGKPFLHRGGRELLQAQVDRRPHTQPAAVETARPDVLVREQLRLHVLAEVGRRAAHAGEVDVLRLRERLLRRPAELRRPDQPLREHQPQHEAPPRPCRRRVPHRVVEARVLRDAREQRRLRQRQLRRRVAEIRPRRPLGAVRAVAEVDRVEVGGEDPVLRPALLELPRERRLLELARERPLVADERVLDELLRDRRASLHRPLVADVREERAAHPAQVDAAVLPEAPVLGRDDRLLQPRRDLGARHEHTALRAAQDGEDRVAVVRIDVAVHLQPVLLGWVEAPELLPDGEHEPEGERRRREHSQHRDQREQAELADPAPVPAPHRPWTLTTPEQAGGF